MDGAAATVDSNIPVDTVIPGFSVGEWHTYAIKRYPDRIEYFVDGIRYQEINTWHTPAGARRRMPASGTCTSTTCASTNKRRPPRAQSTTGAAGA
jgi:hypothetical protein